MKPARPSSQELSSSASSTPVESVLAGGAVNRRNFLAGAAGAALLAAVDRSPAWASAAADTVSVNLAKVATPSASGEGGESRIGELAALNDGFEPENSRDRSHPVFVMWPPSESQWVQYEWTKPVTTNRIEVYWSADNRGGGVPASYKVSYWNGSAFVPVENAKGLGVAADTLNSTIFSPVKTDKIRLEVVPGTVPPQGMRPGGVRPPGIIEWKVFSTGAVPLFPPLANAGMDRSVVLGGKTYLSGSADWLLPSSPRRVRWSKASGPGHVIFEDPTSPDTTATFSVPGEYVLALTALGKPENTVSKLSLRAEKAPPKDRLDVVYTTPVYAIDNPMWNERAKTLIVDWIPHCIEQCERTDLTQGQGGIDNFIEAGKALRGEPHGRHKGYVFSNAWVHQTVEAMSIALMIDPQGDPEIIKRAAEDARDARTTGSPSFSPRRSPTDICRPPSLSPIAAAGPEHWIAWTIAATMKATPPATSSNPPSITTS